MSGRSSRLHLPASVLTRAIWMITLGSEGKRPTMRRALALVFAVFVPGLLACDIGQLTVGTTAKILVRAQPSLQQESDYQLAHDAIPGALKTIEGFWIVDPDNEDLLG